MRFTTRSVRWTLAALALSGALAAVAVGAFVASGQSEEAPSVALLKRPQTTQDRFPADTGQGMRPETARLAGTDGSTEVRVAEHTDGTLCIVAIGPDHFGQSTACTDPDILTDGAIWLKGTRTFAGERRSALYALVPDGFGSAELGVRTVPVRNNVAIFGFGEEAPHLRVWGEAGERTVPIPPAPQTSFDREFDRG